MFSWNFLDEITLQARKEGVDNFLKQRLFWHTAYFLADVILEGRGTQFKEAKAAFRSHRFF